MNTLNSSYSQLCDVSLPYAGRQLYMHTFHSGNPEMPDGFEDYSDIVDSIIKAAGYSGEAHLTVDEKIVLGTQRRPHAHVDGWYYKSRMAWGTPGWGSHRGPRMPVIVASSVKGCTAYPGLFVGEPAEGGDLEHIRDQFTRQDWLEPGRAYLLSPDCVHESMPFSTPTQRTFIRIALGEAK